MTSKEILEKYLEFYKSRGHKQIPNVSLVPEGDSTLLFVNSGMFPLVPYLLGQEHPLGKRLVNVQRAVRMDQKDLDEIGDNRHTTAFHMMGNWSLGDYFKTEQLPWAYEMFVEVLGIDPNKLFVTVFEGDESAPRDTDSIALIKEIFKKYGIDAKEGERIFPYGKDDNWWKRGDAVGELGGPDSETFYYIGEGDPIGKSPAHHQDEFIEIGNSVFMQYIKTETGWELLSSKNVDFGGGLERTALAVQGKKDIFETDNFWPIIEKIQEITKKDYYSDEKIKRSMRIIADHMRASTFLAMDGIVPNNKDQGYVLRRLIRRMVRVARALGVEKDLSASLVGIVVETFSWLYPALVEKQSQIENIFYAEEEKFFNTLKRASITVDKVLVSKNLSTTDLVSKAFELYQSLGYPSETFLEDAKDRGFVVDDMAFHNLFQETFNAHQEVSRAGMEKKFKGGLADQQETTIKYHTATHLIQKALRDALGTHVVQLGSNITGERLRFDFPNKEKLTEDQLKKVEEMVNSFIKNSLSVTYVMLPKEEAIATGALYMKNETYPDTVKVYYIGDSIENAISREFCGGPHVSNTSEIGGIEIFKQETIGEGKQRIYARLKN